MAIKVLDDNVSAKDMVNHIKDCAEAYPTLYSVTGDVKDINTILVPRDELWALIASFHTSPLSKR